MFRQIFVDHESPARQLRTDVVTDMQLLRSGEVWLAGKQEHIPIPIEFRKKLRSHFLNLYQSNGLFHYNLPIVYVGIRQCRKLY